MSAFSPPSGNAVSEFECPGCGHDEAYRSRPRGLFEKFVLPLLMLRPVRCERCYRRSYALRSAPALQRGNSVGRHNGSHPSGISAHQSRIA